jgi:hypothetical protein
MAGWANKREIKYQHPQHTPKTSVRFFRKSRLSGDSLPQSAMYDVVRPKKVLPTLFNFLMVVGVCGPQYCKDDRNRPNHLQKRETRVRQQLVCGQIAWLAAVEDRLGDVLASVGQPAIRGGFPVEPAGFVMPPAPRSVASDQKSRMDPGEPTDEVLDTPSVSTTTTRSR